MFAALALAVLAVPMPEPLPLLHAAALLTTPPGVPEAAPPEAHFPALRDAIHQVAVEWEILDPRETRYVLSRPEDFDADLNMLRRRWQELKDAPRVNDSFRFPEREEVKREIAFNLAYQSHLNERITNGLELHRESRLRDALAETDHLYRVYDGLRDGQCPYYYVSVRRHGLKKARELMGEEAYSTGVLPPPVPTWRFNEMR